MTRALVTGASGFLGMPLVNALLARGVEVIGVARNPGLARAGFIPLAADLLDPASDAIITRHKADLVIHAAWITTHGAFWHAQENSLWQERSIALARAFLEGGTRHIIALGTCVEYDLTVDAALDEVTSACDPVHPYGVAKHATHLALQTLAGEASVSLTWCRMFHLLGRNEHPARLVPSVIRALLRGEEARATIGTQKRDFMHADDAAHAIVHLALGEHAGAFNIGSGESVTIAGLVNRIAAMLGAKHLVRLGALPLRADDPMSILPRLDRLAATGFRPSLTLDQGLADAIAYWQDNAGAKGNA